MAAKKLSKSQVQAAFKRARAHFKGKIPKGTKLARFVPGHHSTGTGGSRNRRSSGKSSRSNGRVSHTVRRIGGAVRHVKRQTIGTTAVNITTLAIGASDIIFRFQENPSNPAAALENLAHDYSAGLKDGSFDWQALIRAYGPILGAIGFKKGIGFLLKRAPVKV